MYTKPKNVERGCLLLTFPFWIYIDENNPPPEKTVLKYKDKRIQIYRPFRSGKANFINMPIPSPSIIPNAVYADEALRKSGMSLGLATIPGFDKDSNGKYQMTLNFGDKWHERPNPFPMDSLRIDFENFNSKSNDNSIISKFYTLLLTWTRILSSQWWINRDVSGLIGYERCIIGINENGKFNTYPRLTATGRTVSGFEKPITNVLWHQIIENVKNDKDWHQHDIFLLDAHYLLANNDLRASLMNTALALETYIEITYNRLWKERSKKIGFKKSRLMSSDLTANLSGNLKRFIGKTYEEADDSRFEDIEDLWLMRHQVAHGSIHQSEKDVSNQIEEKDVKRVISATNDCIEWLKML